MHTYIRTFPAVMKVLSLISAFIFFLEMMNPCEELIAKSFKTYSRPGLKSEKKIRYRSKVVRSTIRATMLYGPTQLSIRRVDEDIHKG